MKSKRILLGVVAACILCAATGVLWRFAQNLTFDAIEQALRRTSVASLYASALATGISFAGLAYYDRFATRLIAPGMVSTGCACFIGAVSHAVSNTLGFPVITGSALRFRLYRQLGLPAADIARVVVLIGFCVALGSISVLLLALLFASATPVYGRAACGAGVLVLVLLLWRVPVIARYLGRYRVSLPALKTGTLLPPFFVGIVEGCAAIGALYLLLPEEIRPGFATMAAVVMGAMLLGVLSHSPGGIGVFEATILATFPANRHADVLAALLLFRLIYNIVPFAMAALLLAVQQGPLTGRISVGRRIERH